MQEDHKIISKAKKLISLKKFDHAIKLLQDNVNVLVWNEQFYALLGICFFHQKNREKAKECFEIGIKRNAENPQNWIGLANVFSDLKQWNKAEEHIDQAIQLNPNVADAFAIKGNILIQKGKLENAIEMLDKALSINPHHFISLELKAFALILQQDFESAENTNLSALAINPNSARAFANTGWRLLQNGDNQGSDRKAARRAFREALKIDPEDKFAIYGYKSSISSKSILYRYCNQLEMYIFKHQHAGKQLFTLIYVFSFCWGIYSFYCRPEISIVELILESLILFIVLSAIPFKIIPRLSFVYLINDEYGRTLLSAKNKALLTISSLVTIAGFSTLLFSEISLFTSLYIVLLGITIGDIDAESKKYTINLLITFLTLVAVLGTLFISCRNGQNLIGSALILTIVSFLVAMARFGRKALDD